MSATKTTPQRTVSRKAVSKAMAKQEVETKQSFNAQLTEGQAEAIRLKAYELYLQRGCQDGNDVEDWKTAEAMVLNQTITG